MIPIRELLDKIKYSPNEKPEDYTLFYYDRIEDKLKELKFVDVNRIEEGFLILISKEKETNIPLHRIKKVKKSNETIWKRKWR